MPFDLTAGSAKRRLVLSSSTAVLALMIAAPAMAQTPAESVESVTVSSSRIQTQGFDAPTPTTVISADELVKQANPNVFNTITELPSLQGSTGTSVGNGGSSNGVNGLSTLNLRGVGTNRNLILIDGERIIPSSTQEVVDISLIPQMLIQRVDVVTGGASASWGSDAVSGVVNFVLDKHYEGFKMNVDGGITNYADDPTAQAQFAAGTSFMGGRAHFEISGEFESDAGINSLNGPRKWYTNPQQLQMYSVGQCQPNGCPGGGPMWVNGLNGNYALFSRGGLITNGPLQGTNFGAGGVASQYNYGYGANGLPATPNRTAAGGIAGCSTGGYCLNGDQSGDQGPGGSIVARLVRGDTYARLSYDITPNWEVYGTAMYSESVTFDKPTQSFYKAANLHIGCDNPYLPQGVAQGCLANNGQTAAYNSQFTNIVQPAGGISGLGGNIYAPAANTDITSPSPLMSGPAGTVVNNGFVNGFSAGQFQYGVQNANLTSVENYDNRTMRRFVLGTDGVFNLFDTDWSFKGYFQHGESDYHNTLENQLITPYYDAAIDAVQVTNNNAASFAGVPVGSVVCRSAVARSVGCQPLNIIGNGPGIASNQALTFVQGLNGDGSSSGENGREPWQIVDQRQDVVDFGVSGTPLEDWAGKISVATGFQYREEAFHTVTDCASQGNCANQVFGGVQYGPGGDPLLNASPGGGLPPYAPNWYAGNFQPARGVFHEWEMFGETDVPLLNDSFWGKIDVDLAGRYTHYTTSGDVETWKVGGTWETPLDGLRLRALQSRDVRAPNLAELFAGARVNNGSVTDDFVNLQKGGIANASITPLPNPITANPNLKPEKGQTTDLGVVWSPSYIPGMNFSVDYWRLAIKGEINTLSQQQEMDLCFQGNALQCSFISSNGQAWAAGGVINTALTQTTPTSQVTPQVNIASVVTDGFDYNLSYRFALDDVIDWGLGGDVTLNMLATETSKFITNPGFFGAVPVESAGSNAGITPHWKTFFTQQYDTDTWGFFVNERWFSEGVINRNWVTCATACPVPVNANFPTVSSNYMPGELYFDIGGNYNLTPHSSLYFKVDNVTNQNPGNANVFQPQSQSFSTNEQLYDVLGRFYHIGFRIND